MRIRYCLVLGGAGVLAVALGAVKLWPEPVLEPVPVAAFSMPEPLPPPPPPPAPPRRVPVRAVEAVTPPPPPPRETPQVSVARMPPEPMIPEPELSHPPPQYNDDIEPELPQTAQWELDKTARLAALVERDVVRLAREREDAVMQGDYQRSEQIDAMLQRNLEHLRGLHDEIRKLVAVVNGVEPSE
ncbi:hypothetical protein A176_007439 [Myxococcus hansupus]|uniref:Uncharacterized protein n=1 Tax=Pseudomyxococcus hansupus TaxID=1297742 RepID=A0A0H4XQ90_9BACT|nr:hypothetical protein [Myxococcus hansupus]AKQ70527.1 hypothetical protein A176_007439 [Myxococcus hansupus]